MHIHSEHLFSLRILSTSLDNRGLRRALAYLFVMFCLTLPQIGLGADISELRQGVVKIVASVDGRQKTGAGFVVRIEPDTAYIVTASHVVEGDKNPKITFFDRQTTIVDGEVLKLEDGDDRGLALLVVRGMGNLPPGLRALVVNSSKGLKAADQTVAIGFPKGGGDWSISSALISGKDGRMLVLSGQIAEGNSGGPLLRDDKVVGVVVQEKQGFGRAVPGDTLQSTLDGWGVSSSNECKLSDITAAIPPSSKAPVAEVERLRGDAERLDRAARHVEAVKQLRAASDLGDFQAGMTLAVRYWSGKGVEKDEVEAMRLFRLVCKAAITGDSAAQFFMGTAYEMPAPWLLPDISVAPKWYQKAADGGHAIAQYNLGHAYFSGKGVTADPSMVLKYWEMAAAQGYPQAQHSLGMLYVRGYGGVINRKVGIAWMEKAAGLGLTASKSALDTLYVQEAAESGNPEAQYQLAQMYLSGKNFTRNVDRAVQLYRISADKGYAPAQYDMAVRYENGDGVQQNLRKAFELYSKAAEQGHSNAQNNLGTMYMQGRAVPQNFIFGVVWFQLAASQGLDLARTNLNLSRQLTFSASDASRINELVKTYRQRYSSKTN